jgi:hypothetical protein
MLEPASGDGSHADARSILRFEGAHGSGPSPRQPLWCRAATVTEDRFPSPEKMYAANAELVGLVRGHLPFRIYAGERWWALFRTASLVRMADTVESLIDLMAAEQDLDGQILVRSLYEQVVTFAWLSIDPDTRQWRWVGEGRWDLLKAHNDATAFGLTLLSGEEVKSWQEFLGLSKADETASDPELWAAETNSDKRRKRPDLERVLPPVTDRALEADEHWSSRIRGLHPKGHLLSFRGLYLPAYRTASRSAHGFLMALDPYLSEEANRRVVSRAQPGPRIMWALVAPLFAMAVVIASHWEK